MLPEIDPRAALPPMTAYYLMKCGLTALVPYYRPGDPAVADAAVIPVADDEAGEVPKAFVVKKGETTADAIMEFVEARVAPYKKLRFVEFIEQIPKSASGKILRRVLVDKERAKKKEEALARP